MAERMDRTPQILAYVLDSLQVVSYKWLSRKLCVSSNESKRLLQIVADKHDSDLDIIYAISGWSKADCSCYSVKLVPKSKLQEAKDMLSGHVSIHVYSIQPCTPKDPAEVWGAEYVQSEELFNQPSGINNCLRDNRGVSCSSVTRRVTDKSVSENAQLAPSKSMAQSMMASTVAAQSTDTIKGANHLTSPPQVSAMKTEVTPDLPSASGPGPARQNVLGNSGMDMEMPPKGFGTIEGSKGVGASKKKNPGSGDGGSLANLWGRATAKSKTIHPCNEAVEAVAANTALKETVMDNPSIYGSSDDEDATNFARLRKGGLANRSTRTRRMIMDDDISDDNTECEDKAVTKHSPKKLKVKKEIKSSAVPEKKGKTPNTFLAQADEVKEDAMCMVSDKEKTAFCDGNQRREPLSAATNGAATSAPEPKKRKVLKTRMDDKGREVTEVVWETENAGETENVNKDHHFNSDGKLQLASNKNSSLKSNVKVGNAGVTNPSNRGSSGGKLAGKPASKDTQQGRISSFFKKST